MRSLFIKWFIVNQHLKKKLKIKNQLKIIKVQYKQINNSSVQNMCTKEIMKNANKVPTNN